MIINKILRNKLSLIAFLVLGVILFAAIFGPGLCKRYQPNKQDYESRSEGISKDHWLGTDYMGRDIFTRLIYGARHSISVSVTGVSAGGIIGIFLGLLAGYYGGVIDRVISGFVEFLMVVPGILLAILVITLFGKGDFNTILAVAFSVIAAFARITRGGVAAVKNSGYIKSCQIIGGSDFRIIFNHILPNVTALIIVTYTLNLGAALLTVSSLSFLGIGVQPPAPEWGSMISAAKDYMLASPLEMIAPGLAITLFVISSSLAGEGLRLALDPRINY